MTASALAKFLQVDASPEHLEKIQKGTSFENMKVSLSDLCMDLSINGQSVIFRKGQSGNTTINVTIKKLDKMRLNII